MTSDSDYEDTDEELVASAAPAAAPPPKTPAKRVSHHDDGEPDYRWLFTNEEYEKFQLKSEKEREEEIFNRMEEDEARKSREEIARKLQELEEKKLVKSHTEGHKTYDDSSSDESFCRGIQRKTKKKKTEKSPGKAKKAAALNISEVFGDDSSSGSSSSSDESSDEDSSKSRSRASSSESSRRHSSDDEDVPKKLVECKEELRKARITRLQLSKFVHAPFFNDVVRGAFVQIRVGKIRQSANDSIICQVLSVEQTAKTYDLENTRTNKGVRIKYGGHEMIYRLNYVSNADWSTAVFDEWRNVAQNMNAVPSVDHVEKKRKEIVGALNHTYTDKEIDLMVKEKKRFFKDQMNPVARKAQLLGELKFAEENHSGADVARIQKEIEDFDKQREREEQESPSPDARKDWMQQLINKKNYLKTDVTPAKFLSPKTPLIKDDGDNVFTRKREHTRVVCGTSAALKSLSKGMKRRAGSPSPQKNKPLQPASQNQQLSFSEDPFALYATMNIDIDFNKMNDLPKPQNPDDIAYEQFKMRRLAGKPPPEKTEFNDLF